jgi:hypothetical protein
MGFKAARAGPDRPRGVQAQLCGFQISGFEFRVSGRERTDLRPRVVRAQLFGFRVPAFGFAGQTWAQSLCGHLGAHSVQPDGALPLRR